eukprot:1848366-Prymnesium_polylepis.1
MKYGSGGSLQCLGIPPDSCSAFGSAARQSMHDETQCIHCPAGHVLIIILIASTIIFCFGAFAAYAYAVHRYPHFQSWIATSSICIHHTQSFMLLSSQLPLRDSSAAWISQFAYAASSDLTVLRPECLLPQGLPMSVVGFALGTGLPVLGLCLLQCCKRIGKIGLPVPESSTRSAPLDARLARADVIEDKLTILYSLQLPVVTRLAVSHIALGPTQGVGKPMVRHV